MEEDKRKAPKISKKQKPSKYRIFELIQENASIDKITNFISSQPHPTNCN